MYFAAINHGQSLLKEINYPQTFFWGSSLALTELFSLDYLLPSTDFLHPQKPNCKKPQPQWSGFQEKHLPTELNKWNIP